MVDVGLAICTNLVACETEKDAAELGFLKTQFVFLLNEEQCVLLQNHEESLPEFTK